MDSQKKPRARIAAGGVTRRERGLVSIVVVSYNDLPHLKKFFASMKRQDYPDLEVILVDNAGNEAVQRLAVRQGARLLVAGGNLGYAGGNNLGARHSRGEFIFIVNSDVTLERGTISRAVRCARNRGDCAVVVPKVLIGDTSRINSIGMRIKDRWWGGLVTNIGYLEEDRGQYDTSRQVFSHDGAAFMVRKDVVDRIGLFDDDYFFMGETYDFTLRVNIAGFSIWTCPAAVVHHYMEGSFRGDRRAAIALKFRRSLRNELATLIKNYEAKTLIWMLPLRLLHSLLWAGQLFLQGNGKVGLSFLLGASSFLGMIPEVLRQRRFVRSIRKVDDRELLRAFL